MNLQDPTYAAISEITPIKTEQITGFLIGVYLHTDLIN